MNKWQRYRRRLKAANRCQRCGRPNLPGYAVCAVCWPKVRQKARAYQRRRFGWAPKQPGSRGRPPLPGPLACGSLRPRHRIIDGMVFEVVFDGT